MKHSSIFGRWKKNILFKIWNFRVDIFFAFRSKFYFVSETPYFYRRISRIFVRYCVLDSESKKERRKKTIFFVFYSEKINFSLEIVLVIWIYCRNKIGQKSCLFSSSSKILIYEIKAKKKTVDQFIKNSSLLKQKKIYKSSFNRVFKSKRFIDIGTFIEWDWNWVSDDLIDEKIEMSCKLNTKR